MKNYDVRQPTLAEIEDIIATSRKLRAEAGSRVLRKAGAGLKDLLKKANFARAHKPA